MNLVLMSFLLIGFVGSLTGAAFSKTLVEDLDGDDYDDDRSSLDKVHDSVVDVVKTLNQLKKRLGALEEANAVLKSQISTLNTTNKQLKEENLDMKSQMKEMGVKLDALHSEIESMGKPVVKEVQKESTHAFFSVSATQPETYTGGDAIRFHHIFTDVKPERSRAGWDADRHRYRCPVSGYYLFVVTLYKQDSQMCNDIKVDLYRENHQYVRIHNRKSSAKAPYVEFSSTMHAVVACAAGEDVWVRSVGEAGVCADHQHSTHFTGMLVMPGGL